ncbi:MAG: sodium:solute symporter family protein [Planctomycetota bacterium]
MTIQLGIVFAYLALLLGLGLFSGGRFRGTRADYQMASRTIGPVLLLLSMFGTTMTAFALVGSTGESVRAGIGVYGMLASSSGIVHSLCFFLIGVKVWTIAQRNGYSTQIEFFRDRLDNDLIGLLLFPILVGLIVPYLLIGVISGGAVINQMGMPGWAGSLLICCVVLIYVFFGGMRGTAWANAFQTTVFMVLGVVTFFVLASRLGGQSGFLENAQTLSEAIPDSHSTREGLSKTKFLTYLLIPLSVGMFPHIFQHWMTAKSAQSFKLPVVWHPIFIMIVWAPCVLIGTWAVAAYGSPDLRPDTADLPANPNQVLAFLVNTQTGAVLGGLLAAGILAAIMSSLDSQFLCIGTIFNNDVVTHYFGKDRFSDEKQVLLTRSFIVGIVAITFLLSLGNVRSVFAMGVWCFSGFSALFPIVVAALYWRGLSALGAIAGVLAAGISWVILFVRGWQVPIEQGGLSKYVIHLNLGESTYEIMPVVAMISCSTIAMVVVSFVTPKPKQETLDRFF